MMKLASYLGVDQALLELDLCSDEFLKDIRRFKNRNEIFEKIKLTLMFFNYNSINIKDLI